MFLVYILCNRWESKRHSVFVSVFKVASIELMTREQKIQNDIRVAVSQCDCTVFRANVGKVLMENGRWFDTGLPKGFPDLFGFRHSDGKFFFIEVKNETGRLRDDQKRFASMLKKYPNVLYGVARSVDDAIDIVKRNGGEEDDS